MSPPPDYTAVADSSPFVRTVWGADYEWPYIERTIERFTEDYKLDLEPDFQRGHVWGDAQRAAYIDFVLSGGPANRTLLFACEGWQTDPVGPLVIVDGKQRLEAVRRFMRNELPVRGALRSEWTGRMRFHVSRFRFEIADADRSAVLRWYIALNRGGTPHTNDEIEKVQQLLAREHAQALRAKLEAP